MNYDDTSTTGTGIAPGDASFAKRFLALFALGLVGVLAVGVSAATGEGGVPGLPELSGPALAALVMLQPAILLSISVAVGLALAPRVRLRSLVDERVRGGSPVLDALRPQLRRALGVGIAAFLAVAGLDALFAPAVDGALAELTPTPETATIGGLVASLPVRLLYGGVTEELLLRYGLLTLFAWTIRVVRSRVGPAQESLGSATAWAAILASAVLFGVGHLPALANAVTPTPALVVRTVALNAVAGVGFGWLYWRDSLEAAMVAHATFHVALVGVSSVALLVA